MPREILDEAANESLAETRSTSVAQLSERYLRQKTHYDDPHVETLISLSEQMSLDVGKEEKAKIVAKPANSQAVETLTQLAKSLGVSVTPEMKRIAATDSQKASDLLVQAALAKGMTEEQIDSALAQY